MNAGSRRGRFRFVVAWFALLLLTICDVGCKPTDTSTRGSVERTAGDAHNDMKNKTESGNPTKIQYLEIVSPDVDAICKTYEQLYGVKFGEPDANLGFARTTKLSNGTVLGIRAPLRASEEPVVRPYFLVEDIEASLTEAAESSAKIALPRLELTGHGSCAIFIQGGVEHGLWQH